MAPPAGRHAPASGRGTDMESKQIRNISSRTIRKSSPFGVPLENAPGTFSHRNHLGRTSIPVRPRNISAQRISFVIRVCSRKRPERLPASPARAPATERSWHGLPPQMMSTGGSTAPLSFVISPTCCMCGKRSFVTSMGNRSISLAHIGSISYSNAARGKPPIPSKRLPIVRRFIGPPPQGCVPR